MSKTAVVILNWNGACYLRRFLGNVVRYSTTPDTYVYIADNNSTDDSIPWIEANFSNVTILRLDKNHGFAGGYNLALEKIDAEYFVLLNSDIDVPEGWLEPLVTYMDANKNVASCQPKILSFNNKGCFEHAGAAGCYIDRFGFPFCRGRIFGRTEADNGQYDSPVSIFWSSGACMIVRSEAWRQCGGFDPDFFAHMEEIDLCWRFLRRGYRIGFIPDSKVYHVGGGSLPYTSPLKVYLNFRNSLFLLYKNLPDRNFRLILFARKIIDGAAAIMFLSKANFSCFHAVLKAHIDYYKSTRSLADKRKEVKRLGPYPENAPVLNKSIVFEFYIRRKHTFRSLKLNF